jgi:hypothetical protein
MFVNPFRRAIQLRKMERMKMATDVEFGPKTGMEGTTLTELGADERLILKLIFS